MSAPTHRSLVDLLPADLLEKLRTAGQVKDFTDRQMIHAQADNSIGLSIILEGRVRFGHYTEQGTFYLTGILGPGHCYGEVTLFADRLRAYQAEAFGQTHVLMIGRNAFNALYDEEPSFARAVTQTITQRLYESLDFADDLRRLTIEQRIARLLLRTARLGGLDDGVLPLRQTDLAFSLGISRVSVGKALDTLQQRKVISLGYGSIRIADATRLAVP